MKDRRALEEMNCLDLFHANDEERCRRFIEEEEYLIISRENGDWMGSGMYFWDNLSNAQYWMKEKSRKNPTGRSVYIVKANISLEKCLDLTDDCVLEFVKSCWNTLRSKTKGLNNNQLGYILNSLFDSSILGKISFAEEYEVLKGVTDYDREESSLFFKKAKPRMTNKPRVIYNVKKVSCILKREGVSC